MVSIEGKEYTYKLMEKSMEPWELQLDHYPFTQVLMSTLSHSSDARSKDTTSNYSNNSDHYLEIQGKSPDSPRSNSSESMIQDPVETEAPKIDAQEGLLYQYDHPIEANKVANPVEDNYVSADGSS